MVKLRQSEPLRWCNVEDYPGRMHHTQLHQPKLHGDVGYDLETAENTRIYDDGITDVPSGVAVQIPDGYWGLVVGRSSALSQGVIVYPGVIDTGYRGPIYARVQKVTNENLGEPTAMINQGARLAQIVLIKTHTPETLQVAELEESTRGSDGFGSTGGTL